MEKEIQAHIIISFLVGYFFRMKFFVIGDNARPVKNQKEKPKLSLPLLPHLPSLFIFSLHVVYFRI